MSKKNDFKAFSISDNANVVSQERYEANQSLQTGFSPDDVPTHVLNKVLRQSSTISAVVANFIATQSGDDILDDGDITKLTAQLNKALERKTNIPVGVPIPWPTAIPPAGWVQCNGAVFDKSKFPKLAEAYPDGRLPDLRGEFIRGWDDGRGIDNGRGVLSWQDSTWIQPNIESNHQASLIPIGNAEGMFNDSFGAVSHIRNIGSSGSRARYYIRPRNIAFNYIVRAA
ncbi:phage tail protein [Photorhabdus asymbiotica]|uniref:phage tail protein n=1 Tax=Photorhabdus asymbiotica TaxID=291112 RepID=UPI003DA70ACC